jgi:hypothetical protein
MTDSVMILASSRCNKLGDDKEWVIVKERNHTLLFTDPVEPTMLLGSLIEDSSSLK